MNRQTINSALVAARLDFLNQEQTTGYDVETLIERRLRETREHLKRAAVHLANARGEVA